MNVTYFAARIALRDALVFVLVALLGFLGLFIAFEPTIAKGQSQQSTFNITMGVEDEIAFVAAPQDVSLTPPPSGITGGTANGSTNVAVRTNATLGYNMTIQASSSSMVNVATSTQTIPPYSPASVGVPDYNFSTNSAGESSQFAFSVTSADDPADIEQVFRHNNAANACNSTDENSTLGQCWLDLPTTALPIVNRGALAGPTTSATTTLSFRVHVPANPSPAVVQGTYRATSTVTVINNS